MAPRAIPRLKDPLCRKHTQRARQRSCICAGLPRKFLRTSRRFLQGIGNTQFRDRMKTPGDAVTHRNSQQEIGRIVHEGGSITPLDGFCRSTMSRSSNHIES